MVQNEELNLFFYYIVERHTIWIRRANRFPFPWTEDEVLQTYSFCNVFRELDKVTIWVRENWREPYADHRNLPFAMAVARQINWPDTLDAIGFPERWEPERVKAIMQARKDQGKKVYTGAYMLTGTLGGTKVEQTVDKILTPLYKNPPVIYPESLEQTWEKYLPYAGFSGFMAYEVVTDLRHTKHLKDAKDIMTWANPGPGAKRGLNRIHDRQINWTSGKHDWNKEMKELLDLSYPELVDNSTYGIQKLEMRDIEHSLCEFDKWRRTMLGQGRPRSKFIPTGKT
jgi:hypothetical protein